jgi:hypothetical protein
MPIFKHIQGLIVDTPIITAEAFSSLIPGILEVFFKAELVQTTEIV